MKKCLLSLYVIALFSLQVIAQNKEPNAGADIDSKQGQERQQRVENERSERNALSLSKTMADSGGLSFRERTLENLAKSSKRRVSRKLLQDIGLYSSDVDRFVKSLGDPRINHTILAPSGNCDEKAKLVNSEEICIKYPIFGLGGAYSFRTKDYKAKYLSDIVYANAGFTTSGFLTQGIFTNIGNISIKDVELDSLKLTYLVNFIPNTNYEQAKSQFEELSKGVRADGRFYSNRIGVSRNDTYILRSIAYRGVLERNLSNVIYNELDYDERDDVIIAFQIVGTDKEGNLTILWKELSRKKAPKMKSPKGLSNVYTIKTSF